MSLHQLLELLELDRKADPVLVLVRVVTEPAQRAGLTVETPDQVLAPDSGAINVPLSTQPPVDLPDDPDFLPERLRYIAQDAVLDCLVTDAVLDVCVLAVAALEHRDVLVGLVGEDRLEAVPVVVGERQLRAGMGTLAPHDQPGPVGPGPAPPRSSHGRGGG